MNIEVIFSAVVQFINSLFGKIVMYVGGVPISLYGMFVAFLCVPVVFMCLIPWYDNDDDDGE